MTDAHSRSPKEPEVDSISTTSTIARLKPLLQLALELRESQDGLPVESAADASQRLAEVGRRVGVPSGDLFERVMAPGTSVPELVRIKEAAKALLAKCDGRDDREAASLLYHAAVAAAVVRYRIQISSCPPGDRRDLYARLASRFAGFQLGDLFRLAADRTPQPALSASAVDCEKGPM
jgi:hypothetical protein